MRIVVPTAQELRLYRTRPSNANDINLHHAGGYLHLGRGVLAVRLQPGILLGIVTYAFKTVHDTSYVDIRYLHVDAKARRQSVAQILFSRVMDDARKAGCLRLNGMVPNLPAVHFLRKNTVELWGFTAEGYAVADSVLPGMPLPFLPEGVDYPRPVRLRDVSWESQLNGTERIPGWRAYPRPILASRPVEDQVRECARCGKLYYPYPGWQASDDVCCIWTMRPGTEIRMGRLSSKKQ